MAGRTEAPFRQSSTAIGVVLVGVYLVVLIRTAWVSDDAYITFRYAYNVVHGHGLVWNPGYRVQAFTNPLWTFLVTAAYFVTREIYYTSLAISMVFSVATLAVVWRLATSTTRFWLGAGVLILSKAYMDFSASGLEDPLLHFLLAMFAYAFLAGWCPRKRLWATSLVGGLLMTTRMDAVLLVAPAVVLTAGEVLDRQCLRQTAVSAGRTMALGGLPFLVWKGFATFYYGFPVPNTYFAKTNTTDSAYELVQQGYHYLVSSFAHDLVLLAGLLGGFTMATVRGDRRLGALAAGAGLYIGYLVTIGGDFMVGRLLTEPLIIAVIVLVRTVDLSAEEVKVGLLLVIALSVGLPSAPPVFQTLAAGADYGGATVNQHGLIDERGFYYPGTGLIANKDRKNTHRWADQGRQWAGSSRRVFVAGVIGMRGYYAGPETHVIDYYALSDPLLARLEGDGRVGHYERHVPAGYVRTIRTGENHLKSEGLHRFYDKLATITTGDLWSPERLGTIVRLNLGAYEHLLAPPLRWTYPLDRVDRPVPNGTAWNAPRAITFDSHVAVVTGGRVYHEVVELSTDHNDRYRLTFANNGTAVGNVTLPPSNAVEEGLVTRRVAVPQAAARQGYTRIRIEAVGGDGMYSVGHVKLLDANATARNRAPLEPDVDR